MRYSCFQLYAKSFFETLETLFFRLKRKQDVELNDIADIEIVNMYSAR